MGDRTPEPWETGAAGPFLTVERERARVELWALGEDRFVVRSSEREEVVVGFDAAREAADALARAAR